MLVGFLAGGRGVVQVGLQCFETVVEFGFDGVGGGEFFGFDFFGDGGR